LDELDVTSQEFSAVQHDHPNTGGGAVERWWMKWVLRPFTGKVKCGNEFNFFSCEPSPENWEPAGPAKG